MQTYPTRLTEGIDSVYFVLTPERVSHWLGNPHLFYYLFFSILGSISSLTKNWNICISLKRLSNAYEHTQLWFLEVLYSCHPITSLLTLCKILAFLCSANSLLLLLVWIEILHPKYCKWHYNLSFPVFAFDLNIVSVFYVWYVYMFL